MIFKSSSKYFEAFEYFFQKTHRNHMLSSLIVVNYSAVLGKTCQKLYLCSMKIIVNTNNIVIIHAFQFCKQNVNKSKQISLK